MSTDSFSTLSLSSELLAVVQELGYQTMTPVQAQSIPVLLQGKDLVGQSKTGSGKTAAFALPILQKINIDNREIQALVLCPTRELSDQVAREFRKLGRRLPQLQIQVLVGGQPVRTQVSSLQNGAHIIVGTPGRILDHLDRGNLDFSFLQTLVLDEADRMLDMGFEEQMQAILDITPLERQTIFFSATFPPMIKGMSKRYQKNPVTITIADEPEKKTEIKQVFYSVPQEHKHDLLIRVLQREKPESAIVFCNQKLTTTYLAASLEKHGVSAAALNGDLEQFDRDKVMAMFRNGSIRVLVATDVAARGLDVADLELVVNYDLAHEPDSYVHRTGRTGRAGKEGLAITLSSPNELERLQEFSRGRGALEQRYADDLKPKASFMGLEPKMKTLYISGGRKDKVRPGDLLGALTGEAAGLEATEVGKIEIHDTYAYVAIAARKAELAIERLQTGKIKGRKFQVRLATL